MQNKLCKLLKEMFLNQWSIFLTLLSKISAEPDFWVAQGMLVWVREAGWAKLPKLLASVPLQLPSKWLRRYLFDSSFQEGTHNTFQHSWEVK